MPFCPNCGAQVEGQFCGSCGKPVAAPVAAPQPAAGTGMADNVAGTLCYLVGLITGILFLVLEPYNKNRSVRFHAFQSIFLNCAIIALVVVLNILMSILSVISHALILLLAPIMMLIWLAFLCLWIYLMVRTYQGTKVVLPVIGPLAEKQA